MGNSFSHFESGASGELTLEQRPELKGKPQNIWAEDTASAKAMRTSLAWLGNKVGKAVWLEYREYEGNGSTERKPQTHDGLVGHG